MSNMMKQLSAYDWLIVAAYIIITLAFLYFHTNVAIWVILFMYFRDRVFEIKRDNGKS